MKTTLRTTFSVPKMVIANLGVIVAAILVRLLNSALPDLVVATIIAFVVLNGAVRILRLKTE